MLTQAERQRTHPSAPPSSPAQRPPSRPAPRASPPEYKRTQSCKSERGGGAPRQRGGRCTFQSVLARETERTLARESHHSECLAKLSAPERRQAGWQLGGHARSSQTGSPASRRAPGSGCPQCCGAPSSRTGSRKSSAARRNGSTQNRCSQQVSASAEHAQVSARASTEAQPSLMRVCVRACVRAGGQARRDSPHAATATLQEASRTAKHTR